MSIRCKLFGHSWGNVDVLLDDLYAVDGEPSYFDTIVTQTCKHCEARNVDGQRIPITIHLVEKNRDPFGEWINRMMGW